MYRYVTLFCSYKWSDSVISIKACHVYGYVSIKLLKKEIVMLCHVRNLWGANIEFSYTQWLNNKLYYHQIWPVACYGNILNEFLCDHHLCYFMDNVCANYKSNISSGNDVHIRANIYGMLYISKLIYMKWCTYQG